MVTTTWSQTAGMTSDTETDNIADYAEQAEASKDAAAASETASASSATASASSASGSSTSAAEALASKSAAETAEANAAASASTATTQASNSSTSATASETSRVASVAAQAAAETAETAAEAAQTAAEAAEAGVATDAATATAQAAIATTQATNSGTSATASEASRVAAVAAQAAAETAETNAETAETNAETAQTAAEAAETSASGFSTSASTSASTATTQAGIATTKAGEAAASATASASSATASEAAKDAALSALDNFQDQYLGDFATDPTTDNDGDPLQAGMLYFNTTDDVMKVYTGSAWVAAYASLSGALLTSNNLSDLANAATARTNLGLGTAATTAASAYATSAQGALADSSVQPNDSPSFGSVTVSGTVDGRDVSSDGTKLDGVEASADVTDTANVTAAGALMDSEVTNLTQVKAFDSSDYATSAQGSTADAALPKSGGAMTGAITTNSTFDGRDVATDGTKLDGVEVSADVTDAVNVTAAGALMDSEVTNLAQVKAFDSSDYATSTQGTTADNALPKAGGTMTGALAGTSATFSGDIGISDKIFHDGDTNTSIRFPDTDTVSFETGGSERARIDSSGNFIVGKTTSDIGAAGTSIESTGCVEINAANTTPLTVSRISDEGDMISFYEGSTLRGRIGIESNDLFITSANSGFRFDFNTNRVVPCTTTGSTADNTDDLGDPSSRWRTGYFGSDLYVGDQIIHDGDTNTYMQFHAADSWRVVTGGSERLKVTNSDVVIGSALKEDYDALSGTTPSVDVDGGGAFSLTMSGNTTFTFASCTSGVGVGFVLQLTGDGSTVTWPSTVDWAGGAAPDAPASGASNLYVFYTRDGGSNWNGVLSSAAYA